MKTYTVVPGGTGPADGYYLRVTDTTGGLVDGLIRFVTQEGAEAEVTQRQKRDAERTVSAGG